MKFQKGMSLTEMLIVTAILTATLGVLASVFSSQQRTSAQLADKVASLDLARTLTATLAGGAVCTFLINQAPAYTFDPMNLTAVNVPPYPRIPSRAEVGAPPVLEVNGAAVASPHSPRLLATSIRIGNVSCAIQPCTPTSDQFNANLIVDFDNTRTATLMAPLMFPIALTTTGGAGAQTLSSCVLTTGGGGGGGGGATFDTVLRDSGPALSCVGMATSPNCPALPIPVFATCPVGYRVSGCGYEIGPWPAFPTNLTGDATPADDYYTNSPAVVVAEGNRCRVEAGQIPACNICFRAHAVCIRDP